MLELSRSSLKRVGKYSEHPEEACWSLLVTAIVELQGHLFYSLNLIPFWIGEHILNNNN